jgi:hypothetical protein
VLGHLGPRRRGTALVRRDEVAKPSAVRDAEPVVIIGHEHGKSIRSPPDRIVKIEEQGSPIHRAADRPRIFKTILSRQVEREGPVWTFGWAYVLRVAWGRTAQTREYRGDVADVMLECFRDRSVFRLRRRHQRAECGNKIGAKPQAHMR